jgi:predicted GNAT family acetyltransferase
MPAAVRHNAALSRFELDEGGATAVLLYRRDGDVMTLHHTETPPHLRGRGIASALVRGALEAARAQGMKVRPRCGFVAGYMAAHPEFDDLRA